MSDELAIRIEFKHRTYSGMTARVGGTLERVPAPSRLIDALISVSSRLDDPPEFKQLSDKLIDCIASADPPVIRCPRGKHVSYCNYAPKYSFSAKEMMRVAYVRFPKEASEVTYYWSGSSISRENLEFIFENIDHLETILSRIYYIGNSDSVVDVTLGHGSAGDVYYPILDQSEDYAVMDSRWTVTRHRHNRELSYTRLTAVSAPPTGVKPLYIPHYRLAYRSVAYGMVGRICRESMPTKRDGRWQKIRLCLSDRVPVHAFESVTSRIHRALTYYSSDGVVTGKDNCAHISFTPVCDSSYVNAVDIRVPLEASVEDARRVWNAVLRLQRVGLRSRRSDDCCRLTVRVIDEDDESSTTWETVTPFISDYRVRSVYRDSRRGWPTAKKIIRQSFVSMGYPEPADIQVVGNCGRHDVCASSFVPFRRKTASSINQGHPVNHAVVRWDTPQTGPISVGKGRYFGWGVMAPVSLGGV